MEIMDIVIVSTIRPKILEKTLESWSKYAFINKEKFRFIINIDNIGLTKEFEPITNIELIKKYGFENIVYNINDEAPSHSAAFKWCFNQATSKYIFSLDDDWELIREIDIDEMVSIHEETSQLANLRVLSHSSAHKQLSRLKYTGKTIFFNGEKCKTYLLPIHLAGSLEYVNYKNSLIPVGKNKFNHFAIHPGLWKIKFINQVKELLDINKDPELEFSLRANSPEIENIINEHWVSGIYASPGDSHYMTDIGREWMEINNFKKKNKERLSTGMKWKKK